MVPSIQALSKKREWKGPFQYEDGALNVDQEDSDSTSMLGNGTTSNAQIGDLMQVLEEVHNQDLTDGQSDKKDNEEDGNSSTKVRRTRYAI